jgi:hypothetical protein
MIISVEADKAFHKIQYSFFIKALKQLGIKGIFLKIIKAIYGKPIANNMLNEQLKAFLLKSKRDKNFLFPYSYSI